MPWYEVPPDGHGVKAVVGPHLRIQIFENLIAMIKPSI